MTGTVRRAAVLTVPTVLLIAGVLVAACSSGAPPPPAPAAAPTAVPPAPAVPPAAPPQAAPTGTPLLWPVADLAAAADLQAKVDAGAQPWTLDPEEVALNYATSTWGWTAPEPRTTGAGTVELSDPRGTATISLVQPVRAGATGIWVVSRESHQNG